MGAESVQQQKYHKMMSNPSSASFRLPMWLCLRPPTTQDHHQKHSSWNDDHDNNSSSVLVLDLPQHHQQQEKKRKNKKCSLVNNKELPGSPKVGCMGQIKHTHNNKLIDHHQLAFLSTNHQSKNKNDNDNNNKYFKLKRMISYSTSFNTTHHTSRNNINGGGGGCGIMISSSSTNSAKFLIHHRHQNNHSKDLDHHVSTSSSPSPSSIISVVDLDPPLPVVKRSPPRVCNEVSSIWKRRCSGGGEAPALKSLNQLSIAINKRPILILPQPPASL